MKKSMHYILCVLSLIMVLQPLKHVMGKQSQSEPAPETATITKWQYCVGCKETVFHYLKKMHQSLAAMEKAGKPPSSVLDANQLSELICDDEYFKQFQPFVRLSCIKLLNDGKQQFLEQFAGATSVQTVLNKADNFKRKQNICVTHFAACTSDEFARANLTKSERTKCNACRIVGNEIEIFQKTIAKGKSLQKYLDDDFCGNLGYSYQPYNWVESVCDDMIEEKLDDIQDILRFNAKVAATGMVPSETATDMMCREFYNCKPVIRSDL